MRIVAILVVAGLMLSFAGCALNAPSPLRGGIYTDMKYPSYYAGASEQGPGSRTGSVKATQILGLVATGDTSIDAACRAGGIAQIKTVDHRYTNILGIVQTWSTDVTGD